MNKCTQAVFLVATILTLLFTKVFIYSIEKQTETVHQQINSATKEREQANKALLEAIIAKQAYEDAKKTLPKCQ